MMEVYLVKVYENKVGLHQPIIAVGKKGKLEKQLLEAYPDSKITFGPRRYDLEEAGFNKVVEGIHPFNMFMWGVD